MDSGKCLWTDDISRHHGGGRSHESGRVLGRGGDAGLSLGVGLIADTISVYESKMPTSRILRPHSTPATLMWLEENYEVADGVCIPRSTLYLHYVDFCSKNNLQPVNAASFGKIIRQQFPQLTTRRLGTRGQSRYHYYGIAIREASAYYQPSYSKKAASNGDSRQEASNRHLPLYSTQTRLGTVLPEFPRLGNLTLPPAADREKLGTFLMMYRTHSQRILDTIVRASFDEVQSFLLHFWQGVPPHLVSILESHTLTNLVGICDSILYKAVANVLLPTTLQSFPDSLTKVIRKFVQELESWLRLALYNQPENLRTVKLEMARRFSRLLRRQMSLNHLAHASRMVVHNTDITSQMLQDWRQIDVSGIARETLYSTEQACNTSLLQFIVKLSKEFATLLEEESPIDAYMEWLETLVTTCVTQEMRRKKLPIRRHARQFLLMWSAFGTRVIRDMTLHSAASFEKPKETIVRLKSYYGALLVNNRYYDWRLLGGRDVCAYGSFHLLRLMFDDYILFLVENVHREEQIQEFLQNIVHDAAPNLQQYYTSDEITFVDESQQTLAQRDQYIEPQSPVQEVPTSTREAEDANGESEQTSSHYTWNGDYYPGTYHNGCVIQGWNAQNGTFTRGDLASGEQFMSVTPAMVVPLQDDEASQIRRPCHSVENDCSYDYVEQYGENRTSDYPYCGGRTGQQEEGYVTTTSVVFHSYSLNQATGSSTAARKDGNEYRNAMQNHLATIPHVYKDNLYASDHFKTT